MYRKVFKNNQITYGVPFQVRIPLQNEALDEIENKQVPDEPADIETPEEILERAREEASLIIKESKYEAARIMDEALEESQQKLCDLEEQARQKGYEDGLEMAKEQYESIIKEAEEIRNSSEEEHNQVIAGLETEIIEIIMDISKKVIGNELSENRESIIYILKQTLEKCSGKNDIVVRVSPDDFDYLAENREKLNSAVPGAGEAEIKNDPALKQGACIVETPFGDVDGSAGTRMGKIEEAFREVLEGR